MGIQRIESVTYTVEDLDTCARFFDDLGLRPIGNGGTGSAETGSGGTGSVFQTLVGQTLRLRTSGEGLPPALEAGSTIREVVWGVDTPAELDRLVALVGSDREVTRDEGGTYHTVDETGFGLGLGLTLTGEGAAGPAEARRSNTMGDVQRWNTPLTTVGRVRPLRMCHVALNIPKAGREEAVAFYVDRLGFTPTDIVPPMGVFMQCEGDDDQHNFLLCHRPDRAGVNHVSFEVPGFDDVIEGGNYMIGRGWQEARRLGRHTIGSNVFRFIHAPCGGRVEYAADMDRADAAYGTRVHETAPPHHIWTLRSSRDAPDD